jgi:hypothetical protein
LIETYSLGGRYTRLRGEIQTVSHLGRSDTLHGFGLDYFL